MAKPLSYLKRVVQSLHGVVEMARLSSKTFRCDTLQSCLSSSKTSRSASKQAKSAGFVAVRVQVNHQSCFASFGWCLIRARSTLVEQISPSCHYKYCGEGSG